MDGSTCQACAAARVRACGEYDLPGCSSCAARAISRSLVAKLALLPPGDPRAVRELHEQVARLMPGVATDRALRMVAQWWQHDRDASAPERA